jgi:ribosome-binding protein aMBF1 (putative translation factor)
MNRHSIATKVAAKKTGKGYTLSAEYCDVCEMPMMTLKGKTDCKVCPAIKKWMQRRDGGIVNNEQGCVDEARDVIDTAEEVDAEIRDSEESRGEMLVDPPVCDSQVDLVVETPLESRVNETPLESVVNETPLANLVDITAVESTESTDSNDSDNSTAIRERARQIIMNAKNRLGVALAAIDDDDDVVQDELAKDEVSVESKSDQSEVVLSESMEEQKVRDRAAKIIMQARKKLHAERGYCAEEVKSKEPIVINIEQKKVCAKIDMYSALSLSSELASLIFYIMCIFQSVEVKPVMKSALMDVSTVPVDEVTPPKEVIPKVEEVVPEVEKEMIDTTEVQKVRSEISTAATLSCIVV